MKLLNPNKLFLRLLSDRLGRSATSLELAPRIKAIGGALPELTSEESNQIKKIWAPIAGEKINLDYWRLYKKLSQKYITPTLVPDNIYWSRIIRALNPVSLTRTYTNKSLYPIIFKGLHQPDIIINVINGVIYDGEMNIIQFDEAANKILNYEKDVIIKPTRATSGGSGVSKIKASDKLDKIKGTLLKYGDNYICQGVVRQSADTAVFNETSLNTFRVNTLNINGKITCEALMMRHGLNGSVVDNFAVGGVVVGMTRDGHFNGNNFNTHLDKLMNLQNGKPYSDYSISKIGDVISLAIDAHQRYMPHIGHAAWDFALDETNKPVMIEVNLMLPGIFMEQLTGGDSIFGPRTEEVIQYAMKRNEHLSWTEFVGGW